MLGANLTREWRFTRVDMDKHLYRLPFVSVDKGFKSLDLIVRLSGVEVPGEGEVAVDVQLGAVSDEP